MMAVAIAWGALKASADHIRTEGANHAHHVAQRDIVTAPLLECLLRRLGETEIGNAREALLDSVVAVGGQQLQRADDAELVEQIAADFVLPALAAIERKLQHADAVPARFQREHAAVFVVGMGDGMHQARRGVQAAQHLLQTGGAGVDGKRLGVNPGRRDLRESGCAQKGEQQAKPCHHARTQFWACSAVRKAIVCRETDQGSIQSTQTEEWARCCATAIQKSIGQARSMYDSCT